MKEKLKTFKLLSISLSLVAALAACNLPGRSGPPTTPNRAGFVDTNTMLVAATQYQTARVTVTNTLPVATGSPIPPNAPIWSVYNYTCELAVGGGTMTMNLAWTDRSNNEEGFKVYRDGQAVATLAPNSTSFVDVAYVATGKALSYSVEAFNKDWLARTSTITSLCQ